MAIVNMPIYRQLFDFLCLASIAISVAEASGRTIGPCGEARMPMLTQNDQQRAEGGRGTNAMGPPPNHRGMSGIPVAAPRIAHRRCESEWGTINQPGKWRPTLTSGRLSRHAMASG